MVTHNKPIDAFPNNYQAQKYFELLMYVCVKMFKFKICK